jgi:hypothetical protein
MRGAKILLSTPPKGVFEECIISGTPSPGTVMEIVPNATSVGGRFTYRASSAATGNRRPVPILLEDYLQGKLSTDAYVSGTHGFLYWPVFGEELNMLVSIPGTGTGAGGVTFIGEGLMVGSNGLLYGVVGSPQAVPFFALEAVVDISGGLSELAWVKFTGY